MPIDTGQYHQYFSVRLLHKAIFVSSSVKKSNVFQFYCSIKQYFSVCVLQKVMFFSLSVTKSNGF